jgi:hypothetical protein
MGGAPKKIGRATKKGAQGLEKMLVEPLEKPVKKLTREVVDTVMNIDKYDRNPPEPEITPEVTPEIVPDEKPTITTRYATRGKRSGQGGTIMEGYGVTTRPKSKRAIT